MEEVFFANGTTALAGALVAAGCRGRLVGIPAAVCPSVPAAVMAAGSIPVLLDIESERLGLCPAALDRAAPRLSGVVAVHAYGVPCRLEEITAVCRRHGLPLIEDCAQAEGAGGTGMLGDVVVFSYGAGKILDLGGGGRAITGNRTLAEGLTAFARSLGLAADPHAGDELGQMYKFLYNRHFPAGLESYAFIMPRLMERLGLAQLGRADGGIVARVAAGRARLDSELSVRRTKARLYGERLEGAPGMVPMSCPSQTAPWRFNLALDPARRDRVFKVLLAEGWRVSTWYPSAAPFMGLSHIIEPLPNAERLGAEILNLPLDAATSEAEISALCDRLSRLMGAP